MRVVGRLPRRAKAGIAMDVPRIDWLHEWDEAFARARAEDKVVLVDVEKDD